MLASSLLNPAAQTHRCAGQRYRGLDEANGVHVGRADEGLAEPAVLPGSDAFERANYMRGAEVLHQRVRLVFALPGRTAQNDHCPKEITMHF